MERAKMSTPEILTIPGVQSCRAVSSMHYLNWQGLLADLHTLRSAP